MKQGQPLTPAEQRELNALLKQAEQNNQAFKQRLIKLWKNRKENLMTPTKTTQSLYITKSNNSAINDNEKPLLEVMEQWFDSLPLAHCYRFEPN